MKLDSLGCQVLLALALGSPIQAQISTNIFTVVPSVSTNIAGSEVQLTLLENGLPPVDVLDYQWSKDGTNLVDTDNIIGSQSNILTIASADLTNTGSYLVSMSVTGVVQATASAVVYVVAQPIVQGIVSGTTGASVTFTALATGGLLAYQWNWQGQPIAGASGSSLSFPNAYANASAGYYTVIVTNVLGATTSSSPGLLFTKPVPAGTYQGLFFDNTNVVVESSGFFQYTLSASKRSFSGKLTIGTSNYPFAGAFSLAHDVQITVNRPQTTPLTLQLQLITINDTPQVIGLLTDGNWVASVSGHRLYFSSRNPTPLAGKYTVALQNTNSSILVPNGDSFGTVLIRKDGSVTLSGYTGDGISIAQSCGLSRLGDWPLHVSLLKGRGRLLGWLRVHPQSGSSIQGTNVFWLKNTGPDKYYPDGFSVLLQPTGSTFIPTNSPVMQFTNGVALFAGGDLYDVNGAPTFDLVRIFLRPSCTFISEPGPETLRLSANCGNGLVTGHFVDFVTGLSTPIKAVILQQQVLISGTFLSTNVCGHFSAGRAQ